MDRRDNFSDWLAEILRRVDNDQDRAQLCDALLSGAAYMIHDREFEEDPDSLDFVLGIAFACENVPLNGASRRTDASPIYEVAQRMTESALLAQHAQTIESLLAIVSRHSRFEKTLFSHGLGILHRAMPQDNHLRHSMGFATASIPEDDRIISSEPLRLAYVKFFTAYLRTRLPHDLKIFAYYIVAIKRFLKSQPSTHNPVEEDSLLAILLRVKKEKDKERTKIARWMPLFTSRLIDPSVLMQAEDKRQVSLLGIWLAHASLLTRETAFTDEMRDDSYWLPLIDFLKRGSNEQRKIAIQIIRVSLGELVMDWNHNEFEEDLPNLDNTTLMPDSRKLEHYLEFCALYENLVLSRFQVSESLERFNRIALSADRTRSSWIFALLSGAFGPKMPPIVCNAVTEWMFQIPQWPILSNLKSYENFSEFLCHYFLPWATQGHHFTGTIARDGADTCCYFGESLSVFLFRIIRNNHTRNTLNQSGSQSRLIQNQGSQKIIHGLIDFLSTRQSHINRYAAAYVMFGVTAGLSESGLSSDELDELPVIAKPSPMLPIVDEIHYDFAISTEQKFGSLDSLDATHIPPSAEDESGTSVNGQLIEQIMQKRNLARGVYLSADVAAAMMTKMGQLASTCDKEDSLSHLCLIMSTFCESLEIQDYPRVLVVKLPSLVRDLRKALHCPGLLAHLISLLKKLQELYEGRMYVFVAFAEILRSSLFVLLPSESKSWVRELLVSFVRSPPRFKAEFLLEMAVAPIVRVMRDVSRQGSKALPLETVWGEVEKGEDFEKAAAKLYHDFYGHTSGYAFAAMFDIFTRLIAEPGGGTDFVFFTIDQILKPWLDQARGEKAKAIPSFSKRKNSLQLQVVLLLINSSVKNASDRAGQYISDIDDILHVEPLPQYRYLLEWILSIVFFYHKDLRSIIYEKLQLTTHASPMYIASWTKLAVLACDCADADELFGEQVMPQLIPLAASPRQPVRSEAHWSFLKLWEIACRKGWRSICSNPAYLALHTFLSGLGQYATPSPDQERSRHPRPGEDIFLIDVFEGVYLELEPASQPLVTVEDFAHVWDDDETHYGQKCAPPKGFGVGSTVPRVKNRTIPVVKTRLKELLTPTEPALDNAITSTAWNSFPANAGHIPIQMKARTWKDADKLYRDMMPDPYALADEGPSQRVRRSPLLLVASLIEYPYNLGGLSRVAEIFGAHTLFVADTKVIGNRDFTSVSVSSEKHIEIAELTKSDLERGQWFDDRKRDGFTIVGIEQTDRSLMLGTQAAAEVLLGLQRRTSAASSGAPGGDAVQATPRAWDPSDGKVVVIIGRERDGIPASILQEVDVCLEIPQLGVTRSMNVQTATAVVLYEYTRLRQERERSMQAKEYRPINPKDET